MRFILKRVSALRLSPTRLHRAMCRQVVEVEDPAVARLIIAEGNLVPTYHAFRVVGEWTDPDRAVREDAMNDPLVARPRQCAVATAVPVDDPAGVFVEQNGWMTMRPARSFALFVSTSVVELDPSGMPLTMPPE